MVNAQPVRERILTAAGRLFAEAGVRAVGVDAIISAAGVAKASFYHHFPSKDALVVAWLRSPEARWLDPVRDEVAATAPSPGDCLATFLTVLADLISVPHFSGSPYLNTAAEFHDASPEVREALVEFVVEVQSYLRSLVVDAGIDPPEPLTAALWMLCAGSLSLTMLLQDRGAAAREAIEGMRRQVADSV